MPDTKLLLVTKGQQGSVSAADRLLRGAAGKVSRCLWRRQLRHVARLRELAPLAATGECATWRMGPMTLFNARSDACELVRDAGTIASSPFRGHAMVVNLLRGSARGETGGQLVSLRRGDVGLFDMDATAHFTLTECASVGMLVPANLLAGDLGAMILREAQLPAQMLARHLRNTILALPETRPPRIEASVQATLAILQLCLDFAPAITKPKGVASLRATILAFIEENLDNTELAPEHLCRKFGISRTWLYKVFAAEGGVKRVIRDKRLDAAFRDLCNDPDQRIIDVAFRRAFSSERQFQRAFLAQFGVSPSAVRDARKRGMPLEIGTSGRGGHSAA